MPENSSTALVKTTQSTTLVRVSNQLTLTDKLLTKPEETFLIPYRKGDKWGFCDQEKNIVIACIYDTVWGFREGISGVFQDQNFYYIDTKGNKLFNNVYDDTRLISNGRIRVIKDGKHGFIDRLGNVIVPCILEEATGFSDGAARVRISNKWGLIDIHGHPITEFEFDEIIGESTLFQEGVAEVRKENKVGFINSKGKMIGEIIFDEVKWFSGGYASVTINTKTAFIDKKGDFCCDFTYDDIGYFSEGVAAITTNEGIVGFIDKSGNIISLTPYKRELDWPVFDSFGGSRHTLSYSSSNRNYEISGYQMSSGLVGIIDKNKFGFINIWGETVIPFEYEESVSYRYKEGSVLIDGGYVFQKGLCRVIKNKKVGVIDTTGKPILDLKYSYASITDKWIAVGQQVENINHLPNIPVALFDLNGNQLTKFYDERWYNDIGGYWGRGYLGVLQDGKPGLIDSNGIEYWED